MPRAAKVSNSPNVRGTAFVVMGFGKKTDFETGRVLDGDRQETAQGQLDKLRRMLEDSR